MLKIFYIIVVITIVEASDNSLVESWPTPHVLTLVFKVQCFRDEQRFRKPGKTKKPCNHRERKQELDAVFDDWDDFEAQLVAWNHEWAFSQRSLPIDFTL
jgi:hypothetical protein